MRVTLSLFVIICSGIAQASVNLSEFRFGVQLVSQCEVIWTTTSETDNNSFKLERSFNGTDWIRVASVAGNGTTTEPHTYQVTDTRPYPGINYYRLRIVDNSGNASFSQVITVDFGQSDCGFYIYPTSVVSTLLVNWEGCDIKYWAYKVVRLTGQIMLYGEVDGQSYSQFDLSTLPAGDYFFVAEAKGSKTLKARFRKS